VNVLMPSPFHRYKREIGGGTFSLPGCLFLSLVETARHSLNRVCSRDRTSAAALQPSRKRSADHALLRSDDPGEASKTVGLDQKDAGLRRRRVCRHPGNRIESGHQRVDPGGALSLFGNDDSVAFRLNARVAHGPSHQALAAVHQRPDSFQPRLTDDRPVRKCRV